MSLAWRSYLGFRLRLGLAFLPQNSRATPCTYPAYLELKNHPKGFLVANRSSPLAFQDNPVVRDGVGAKSKASLENYNRHLGELALRRIVAVAQ